MNNVSNVKITMAMRAIAGFVSLCIGRKAKIVWGQSASCDANGTIYLPRPKTGEANEVAMLSRQAVHEAGHNVHSDFSCLQGVSGDVTALLQVLEDPRIENQQMRSFPGASLILNRGLAETLDVFQEKLDPENPEHKAPLVVVNVLLKGLLQLAPHRAVVEKSAPIVAKGDSVLGSEGVAAVDAAVQSLSSCQTTSDALAVATQLWAMLNPPEPEQPPAEPQASDDQAEDESPQDQQQEQSGAAGQPDQDEAAADEAQGPGQQGAGDAGEQDDQGSSQDQAGKGSTPDPAEQGGEQQAAGEPGKPQTGESGDGQPSTEQQQAQGGAEAGGSGQSLDQQSNGQAAGGSGDGQPGVKQPSVSSQKQKLDLSSETGMDMGKLLEEAYEAKFGKPDIDPQGTVSDAAESDDDMEAALAVAMEQAEQDGTDLEKALELVKADLEAVEAEPDAGESQSSSGGLGGALGDPIKLDLEVRLSGVVSRLVRVFTKELQDKRRRPVKFAPAGGQIAGNRVWRLKRLGDTNVFRVRAPVTGIDAAAQIYLDRSDSMRHDILCAAEVSLACSQALERISRVKTSIEMFPAQYGVPGYLETLQPFGLSARQVAKRTEGIVAAGGTPLAEAILEGLPKLMAQKVNKRVMLIVTDGEPNDLSKAIAAIAKAESLGVDVMGIGIGLHGKAIQGLVPYSICINTASELPGALEKLFNSQMAEKLAA